MPDLRRSFTRLSIALCAAAASSAVMAGSASFTGLLDADTPNDVALIEFSTSATADLDIQTWSFGGGVNAAGASIAAGGFDPYVSLFSGWGAAATFLASNDDGLCPPGTPSPTPSPSCADSTLRLANLAAGRYTLALTLPSNFSFAENLGSGTLGDGFIGLAASWSDGACAASCSSAYAVDVSSATLVPEPSAMSLLSLGLLALSVRRRWRS